MSLYERLKAIDIDGREPGWADTQWALIRDEALPLILRLIEAANDKMSSPWDASTRLEVATRRLTNQPSISDEQLAAWLAANPAHYDGFRDELIKAALDWGAPMPTMEQLAERVRLGVKK